MKNRYGLMACFLLGAGVASALMIRLQQGCINRWKSAAEKNRGIFLLMDQWIYIKQEGKNLADFFTKNKYKRLAIYGMGYVGKRLVKELKNSGVEIVYGIDRNAAGIHSEIKLLTVNDSLLNVDAVVATSIGEYDVICDALSGKLDCPVIAIEDIINEV